jgi:hypothetical protein
MHDALAAAADGPNATFITSDLLLQYSDETLAIYICETAETFATYV